MLQEQIPRKDFYNHGHKKNNELSGMTPEDSYLTHSLYKKGL